MTKPFTVSDPIANDSSSSKGSKPIKLGSEIESDESFIDDIDVSDEETQKLARENNITEFKKVCHNGCCGKNLIRKKILVARNISFFTTVQKLWMQNV